MKTKKIVVFDDSCPFCRYSVSYLKKIDTNMKLEYQGYQFAQKAEPVPDSVAFYNDNKAYVKSAAILHMFKEMSFPYKLLFAFIVVPRPIRDLVYDWVAKNRFKFFKKEADKKR